MISPPDLIDRSLPPAKAGDALIAALTVRVESLSVVNAALTVRVESLSVVNAQLAARVAELEAKLNGPRKGPKNSSVPPSQGQKPSGDGKSRPKANPHPGASQGWEVRLTRFLS